MIVHETNGGPTRERTSPLETVAFCTLWTSGSDPSIDGVVRVHALRPARAGRPAERFERICDPSAGRELDAAALERIERDFGIARDAWSSAASPADAWRDFQAFVGAGPIVAADAEVFDAWNAQLSSELDRRVVTLGLTEIVSLFLPGRLALRRDELVELFTERRAPHVPDDIVRACGAVADVFRALPEDAQRLAAQGYARAARELFTSDERAARRILFALALLDRGGEWRGEGPRGDDGALSGFAREPIPLEDLVEVLRPRCARELDKLAALENLPPERDGELPFADEDRATLDAVFERHLPELFAQDGGERRYRKSQHAVAKEVAHALGSRELLLVHAPTGTGKTLAYLMPAFLWAARHEVRVGIATYTRALQEQAMDREVPRALAALARAGRPGPWRVAILKGRENYLCWRALKAHVPDDEDAAAWLAFTATALFALVDLDGDVDRMPKRAPLALENASLYVRAHATLLRAVRARAGCCSHRSDRETCAAEVARKKAERSHVVLVNQAFALARQEFFRHVVFDECEHLHDQAHNAWSRATSFAAMRTLLARLRQPGRSGSRAALDRLAKLVLPGSPTFDAVERAANVCGDARAAIDELETSARTFDAWREEAARGRQDRDTHALLREYVEAEAGSTELVARRVALARALAKLDATLSELAERIDPLPLRGIAPARRALDLARADLAEVFEVVEAWIPLDEGKPRFRPRTFYDLEKEPSGDLVLASRVLLPNEFLGRFYFPGLATGVFVSATTWLGNGFDAARSYLGLDRAEHPGPDEEREGRSVRAFRAPEVFDYSRVLVAAPHDAPSVVEKDAFLDYVRRFVAHLGERTRGRMLVLFTNAADAKQVGVRLEGFFRARKIPLFFQNMEGASKEELSSLFRARLGSVLFGVDTFWYGADFPGETLEYLVIVRLPYGVPDRYHHAQCAALGVGEQRRQIYLPRALAKLRQGFGRLMRRESDRGCVFVLDKRIAEPRHRFFLRELPLLLDPDADEHGARFVRGDTDACVDEALAHMGLTNDVARRALDARFDGRESEPARDERRFDSPLDIPPEDVPF